MIKRAEVLFDHTSLRAAILDLSDTGARIYLYSPSNVPEVVALRLPDGAIHAACRRWQRDNQIGFEFLTPVAGQGSGT
jgi:hypothetical protein